MDRRIFVFLLILISAATAAFPAERPERVISGSAATTPPAPTVLSIVPAQAEPGGRVMIFGAGFGDSIRVFLGSVEIPNRVTDGKQVEFAVPAQLQPGLYALYLKRGDGAISRPYNFTVLPLRPVLIGLSPDQIDFCAKGGDREVTALGQNFSENSLLLFDGAGIKSKFISSEAISFVVPQASGGLHQILIRNSSDNASLPMSLTIETKPEISQITTGTEHVNYYELVVDGRNFQQNSSLYVDGIRIGGRGGQEASERERLIYLDCSRLIYQRYPYSPVDKTIRIQVINPDGGASQVMTITAP